VLRQSERLAGAATLLFQNCYYYQATARAYYSVHVLTDFIARRTLAWPWPNENGVDHPRAGHDWTPLYVFRVYTDAGKDPQEAKAARILTVELLSGRITADYYGYVECPEDLARRLVVGAHGLVTVLAPQVTLSDARPLIRP
jgi:hypothetical protein